MQTYFWGDGLWRLIWMKYQLLICVIGTVSWCKVVRVPDMCGDAWGGDEQVSGEDCLMKSDDDEYVVDDRAYGENYQPQKSRTEDLS